MSNEKKPIIGYKLQPITKDHFGGMQPTSPSVCLLSRISLSGRGANRNIISKEAYDVLTQNHKFLYEIQNLIRNKIYEN